MTPLVIVACVAGYLLLAGVTYGVALRITKGDHDDAALAAIVLPLLPVFAIMCVVVIIVVTIGKVFYGQRGE